MTSPNRHEPRPSRARFRARYALIAVTVLAGAAGCGHLMMMIHGTGAQPPAASEFGYGPRPSAGGLFQGLVEPQEEVKPRKVHSWTLTLTHAGGEPVEGAAVEVDGGMPQHGHGLPTRPRVTRYLGDGTYLVEGVRFNMGGWWEMRFRVRAAAGADSIVFNLQL